MPTFRNLTAGEKEGRDVRDGEQTKATIIEVATMLFYERGFHGTNMREIGEGVGIRPASIYNHVASKEVLLYQIALGAMNELYDLGKQAVSSSDDPSEQLTALVRGHVIYHAHNRHRAKVSDDQLHALSPEHLSEVLAVRDGYESLLKGILTSGRDTLGWSIRDVPVLTFALATMCTAVGVWFRENGRLSAEAVADIYAGIAVAAVTSGELTTATHVSV